MARKTLLTALVVLVLSAPTAFAAAAEGGGNNIFAGDLGNALWTLVIFLLAVFILGKFAWGPLLSTLQDRESFIRDSLAEAKQDRDEAAAKLQEYTDKLHEARTEATAIVEEGRRDAEVVRRTIEQEARDESDKMLDRAKREIEIAKSTAVRELYETSAALATDVAARVLRREVKAEDHERLISEAISELGEQDLN